MPQLSQVDHLSLTVTDLEVSHAFYCDVLDFVQIYDFGYGRIYVHNPSAFILTLVAHPERVGGRFTELTTGLDHLGLAAADLDDLRAWEQRFRERGVEFTPIREAEFGYHLNFRDPDGIALEFGVSKDDFAAAMALVRSGQLTRDQITHYAQQMTAAAAG
ncbi:VOC family protein [Nakamurella sp.]|uniref:VOC family protein n=1 Tax=Nakamurella sp. TaxID=1869182 RepID=UPI003B3A5D7A